MSQIPWMALLLALLTLSPLTSLQARYEEVKKDGGFFLGKDRIHLYFFHEKESCLKVLDEGDSPEKRKYGAHDKAFASAGCTAGINGGYFTKENQPLGLVVQEGKRLHVVETGSFAVSGLIYDDGGKIGITRSKNYLSWSKEKRNSVKQALQGGPFLVENGKKIKGLDKERPAFRTFVATNGQGSWCLGVSSSLTLDEIAAWLSTPKALGDFTVSTALNLDGGSSSLFWTSSSGSLISPIKGVRNYLGIAPRKK